MSDNSNETGNDISAIAETLRELLDVHKDILKTLERIRDKPERSIPRSPQPDG